MKVLEIENLSTDDFEKLSKKAAKKLASGKLTFSAVESDPVKVRSSGLYVSMHASLSNYEKIICSFPIYYTIVQISPCKGINKQINAMCSYRSSRLLQSSSGQATARGNATTPRILSIRFSTISRMAAAGRSQNGGPGTTGRAMNSCSLPPLTPLWTRVCYYANPFSITACIIHLWQCVAMLMTTASCNPIIVIENHACPP